MIVAPSGPDLVYWINAATFLLSVLLLLRIPARLLQSEQAITRGHWRDLADGLGAFRRSAAILTVLVAFGFAMLATGLINVSEIFLAERALHTRRVRLRPARGRRPASGLVAGSLVSGALLESRELTDIYPLAFLPWAAGIFAAAIAQNIWVAALAMVVAGFGNGLTFPMTVLIVQRYTADRLRGRAFTLIISAHNAAARARDGRRGRAHRSCRARAGRTSSPRRSSGQGASPRSSSHAASLQRPKWRASRPRSICRRGRTP